jgi:hypothetical protein
MTTTAQRHANETASGAHRREMGQPANNSGIVAGLSIDAAAAASAAARIATLTSVADVVPLNAR